MNKLTALGMAVLLGGTAFLSTSCEDATIDDFDGGSTTTVEIKDDSSTSDTDKDSDEVSSKAIFANFGIEGILQGIMIKIGQEVIIPVLNLDQITNYIDIPVGENVVVEILSSTGQVLSTKTFSFVEDAIYNVIVVPDAISGLPLINIIEVNPLDFLSGGKILEGLDLDPALISTYAFNVLNFLDLDAEVSVLGIDLVDLNGGVITGLIELPLGAVSGVVAGNGDILSNLDILGSDLAFNDLLNELVSENIVDDVLDLGGLSILSGVTGLVDGLLDVLSNLLGGIFGGSGPDLDILDGVLMDQIPFDVGHNYTVILLEQAGEIVYKIIDHTALGLK